MDTEWIRSGFPAIEDLGLHSTWLSSHHIYKWLPSHQGPLARGFPAIAAINVRPGSIYTWLFSHHSYQCEDLGPSITWLSSHHSYQCEDLGPSSTWLPSHCSYKCEDQGPLARGFPAIAAINVRTWVHLARFAAIAAINVKSCFQVGIGRPAIIDTNVAMESLLRHRLSAYIAPMMLEKSLL